MATLALFREDAYLRECDARVVAVHEAGIELDRTVFYPLGGGQAGDTGWLARAERALEGHDDCSGAGWVAVERARRTSGEECLRGATRAFEIGRACGDDDLEDVAYADDVPVFGDLTGERLSSKRCHCLKPTTKSRTK